MSNKNLLFPIILISGIILDLLTKHLASIYLMKKINIIGSFFYLEFVENPGIAFSINIPFLKIITIILIFIIFWYYFQENKKIKEKSSKIDENLNNLSFSLILAGAIGNGYGRILDEKVIDFIGLKYFSVFNLADIFITVGAMILIYKLIKFKN